MSDSLEAREARLYRTAVRQGLAIEKSHLCDGKSGYRIVDPQTEAVVRDGPSGDYSLTIEQAEAFLGDLQNTKSIPVADLNAANDD